MGRTRKRHSLSGCRRGIQHALLDAATGTHLDVLRAHRLTFTGTGDPRIVELPAHPFFLATLFQPERGGDGARAHPLIAGLASAAVDRAGAR